MNDSIPLKIGKYTFGVSFVIGNIFLFGFLFCKAIKSNNIATDFAIAGFFYLIVAKYINIAILLILLFWGIFGFWNVERKKCFVGIAIMLINIPIAFLYAILGLFLLGCKI